MKTTLLRAPMVLMTLAVVTSCATPSTEPQLTTTSQPAKYMPRADYSCDADAPTGRVFALERSDEHPFDVQVPELRGWVRNEVPGARTGGLSLWRRDQLPNDFRSPAAMITVTISSRQLSEAEALESMRRARHAMPDWQSHVDEQLAACGRSSRHVVGTFTSSSEEWWEDRRLVVCVCGGAVHTIHLAGRAKMTDLDRFGPDLISVLNGLQILV
ncbi:hypothetical protein [Nocardia sp. NPDC058480]|uniref:hypothetical protein n=1 Tax=unclassified Nocardia TaxID=2637762 RepID=UPI00365C7582